MEKESRGRTITCMNRRTRSELIIISGYVTQGEQRIVDQISWQITSWHETTKKVAEEITSAKEQIEKMTNNLKRMRKTIVLTDGRVE
jgi:predicted  nucleic acid-binding Zn-ribbon protein